MAARPPTTPPAMAPVFVPPPELGVDVDVAAGKQVVVGHSVQVRLDSTQVSPEAQLQTAAVVHVMQLRKVRWWEKSRRTVRVSNIHIIAIRRGIPFVEVIVTGINKQNQKCKTKGRKLSDVRRRSTAVITSVVYV